MNGRPLDAAEGGFALGVETELMEWTEVDRTAAGVASPYGSSGVQSLLGYETAELIRPNANTNILHPRTILPTLHASLKPGVHVLASAIYGDPTPGVSWQPISPESLNLVIRERDIVLKNCQGNEVRIELG
ncbi:hypothetical protein D3C81_1837770 [compost metagenome]